MSMSMSIDRNVNFIGDEKSEEHLNGLLSCRYVYVFMLLEDQVYVLDICRDLCICLSIHGIGG